MADLCESGIPASSGWGAVKPWPWKTESLYAKLVIKKSMQDAVAPPGISIIFAKPENKKARLISQSGLNELSN